MIDFWRYSWDPGRGEWRATTEDVDLTVETYMAILSGAADFVSGCQPITIDPLPDDEQYWAVCEFFPSPNNDGPAPG